MFLLSAGIILGLVLLLWSAEDAGGVVAVQPVDVGVEPDDDRMPLRARVMAAAEAESGGVKTGGDKYKVEMCGSLFSPWERHDTDLLLQMRDVTDGPELAAAVLTDDQANAAEGGSFRHQRFNGKMTRGWSTLSNWMTVATVNMDTLRLARMGLRTLELSVTVISCRTGEALAGASTTFNYSNMALGYRDIQDNAAEVRHLSVALARAVARAGGGGQAERRMIDSWREARGWMEDEEGVIGQGWQWIKERAAGAAGRWLGAGGQRAEKMSRRLTEIAPAAHRYEVLEVCLQVAAADGRANKGELVLLRQMAGWLEVDRGRFEAAAERILPVTMHQEQDLEMLLGITAEMDRETLRGRLSREYRKWNGRVTHTDQQVRQQATQMLELIAQVRARCVR